MTLDRNRAKGRVSRHLVIDADIAFSASQRHSTNERSRFCRAFLEAVLSICHKAVLSSDLAAEWDNRQSPFFRGWRVQMKMANKTISVNPASSNQDLVDRVIETASSEKARASMLKDMHLIQAALCGDKIVVSLDLEAKRLFDQAADSVPELKEIMWIDPVEMKGGLDSWLKKGLSPKADLKLGFRPKKKKP